MKKVLFELSVHALVLLLPSLLLVGYYGMGWPLVFFALSVLLAGALESCFVVDREFTIDTAKAKDPLALRMAMVAGLALLLFFWLAQLDFTIGLFSPVPGRLPVSWCVTLGMAIVFCGTALRVAAITTLQGQFVSDVCRKGPKIKHGVYGWLNHPGELGQWLIAAGGTFVLSPPVCVLAIGFLTPFAIWRVRREDAILR